MGGLLLGAGLRAADLIAHLLPRPVAYALADLAGRAWHRVAASRRRLVAANLARVCAATGRPTEGRAFRKLVERAFVEHARYYLEMLRIPHDSIEAVREMVSADEWERWEPMLRNGAVVATLHFGNPEPYGSFIAAHGLHGVAPAEEIEPRALFEFLMARRASGRGVDVVPLSRARRPMLDELKRGGFVAMAADRDLAGDGHPVTLFGAQTTLPTGPAGLALMSGRPLLAAGCWRVGPERFRARGWLVEAPLSGNRKADIGALTEALGRRFEEVIATNPEQWFAAFQPIWTDDRTAADG
jgi:phosphatidylinositol dimannoside acyltransferase